MAEAGKKKKKQTAIIIGAGPAGLTAAYELLHNTDITPVVYEASNDIGGISKTVRYKVTVSILAATVFSVNPTRSCSGGTISCQSKKLQKQKASRSNTRAKPEKWPAATALILKRPTMS